MPRYNEHQRPAVGSIAEGFSVEFRKRCSAHTSSIRRVICGCLRSFPHRKLDPAAIAAVSHFGDIWLGKGIVNAKDTPNFIGNRIGTFSVLNVMRVMQEMDFSIEDIDALTGSA